MSPPETSRPGPARKELIEHGRRCCAQREWSDAFDALSRADDADPLSPHDLERLALAAYMLNRDDAYLETLDRAHHRHQAAGDQRRAARCAFWLGLRLELKGQAARANGWYARADRLLEQEPPDCAERGYLLLPAVDRHLAAGDADAAFAAAATAAEIGDRHAEPDLVACARHLQGLMRMQQGKVIEGIRLVDEVMLSLTADEISPLVAGLIYCNVIDGCRRVYALDRARDWTFALTKWCEEQPQMIAFTGKCVVHRAEILQLQGAWHEALEEVERACERFARGLDPNPPAAAEYQRGEIHRLRGELEAAEKAYRAAGEAGWEPQPGMALLRLAQGRVEAAAAAIRRARAAAQDPLERAGLLPACVEILVASGALQEAEAAGRELLEIADRTGAGLLAAASAHAGGQVLLARGDASAACRELRRACDAWKALEAPYPAARARELLALACFALQDADGGELGISAARAAFERLGAAPDVARIDTRGRAGANRPHGLTPRELEVLRLVASGKTNKDVARALSLSEKTVDRHLSNIFNKLDVSSRTAATAYAYEHNLVG